MIKWKAFSYPSLICSAPGCKETFVGEEGDDIETLIDSARFHDWKAIKVFRKTRPLDPSERYPHHLTDEEIALGVFPFYFEEVDFDEEDIPEDMHESWCCPECWERGAAKSSIKEYHAARVVRAFLAHQSGEIPLAEYAETCVSFQEALGSIKEHTQFHDIRIGISSGCLDYSVMVAPFWLYMDSPEERSRAVWVEKRTPFRLYQEFYRYSPQRRKLQFMNTREEPKE